VGLPASSPWWSCRCCVTNTDSPSPGATIATMKALLQRIEDGHTDLVFDYRAQAAGRVDMWALVRACEHCGDPSMLNARDSQRFHRPEAKRRCVACALGDAWILTEPDTGIRQPDANQRTAGTDSRATQGRMHVDPTRPRSSSRVATWERTDGDSNPGDAFTSTRFPGVRLKPLGHPS
jgi:hypothetical protein